MRGVSILQNGAPFRRGSRVVYPSGQDVPRCFLCGRSGMVDLHHIYHGSNRNTSDELGFWVYLCHDEHMALHDHREPFEALDMDLKRMCQREFERTHTRLEFMRLIGRSYL